MSNINIEQEVQGAVDKALQYGIDDIVQQALAKQSWYRSYANTVNAAIGIVTTTAATLVSYGVNFPSGVTTALVIVGAIGTILGVSRTTNGVQPETARILRDAAQ